MKPGVLSQTGFMPDVPKSNRAPGDRRFADSAAWRRIGKSDADGAFGLRKISGWLGLNDDARLAQW
jgi:hypothetical protein